LRVLFANQAAGEPAGVAGFIREPELDAAPGCLLDRELHQEKVLRRKVRRVPSARHRDVRDEYAIGSHPVEILDDAFPGMSAVPSNPRLDGARTRAAAS